MLRSYECTSHRVLLHKFRRSLYFAEDAFLLFFFIADIRHPDIPTSRGIVRLFIRVPAELSHPAFSLLVLLLLFLLSLVDTQPR